MKRFGLKRLFGVLLASVTVFTMAPINLTSISAQADVVNEQPDASNIIGEWSGSYDGTSHGKTIKRLISIDIEYCDDNGSIKGIAEIDSGVNGKYTFSGDIDYYDNKISLEGDTWINNPSNFGFSKFIGTYDENSNKIEGSLDNDDKRSFLITKERDNSSNNISVEDFPKDYSGEYDGNSGNIVVRRNIEIHITDIKDNGAIKGTAVISPSDKADKQYGANGSYYFGGVLSKNTGIISISMQGNEWIDYPVQYDHFGFIKLAGHYNSNSKSISGVSEYGIWEMKPIDYSDVKTESGFTLGRDNNSFTHSKSVGGGFYGVNDYSFSEDILAHSKLTDAEKNVVKDGMHPKDGWGGSCYGIAMTMGLLYEKYISIGDLTNDKNCTNYYSLQAPSDDYKLLSTINYYQLTQGLKNGGASSAIVSKAYNYNVFTGLKNWIVGDDSLTVFLKNLVNYAVDDHVELLGYVYPSPDSPSGYSGHSILVTGCSFNSSTQKYEVQLYDENCTVRYPKGKFIKMDINKDFSRFSFTDSNNHIINNFTFREIHFLDWNSLKHVITTYNNHLMEPVNSNDGVMKGVSKNVKSGSDNHSNIIVYPTGKFRITTDGGKYIEYDGSNFSGDMNIYDCQPIINENKSGFNIETDKFGSLTVSDISDEIDIRVYDASNYMDLSGKGIGSALLNIGKNIKLSGTSYDFKAYIGTDKISDNEAGLVSVSAHASSDVTITRDGNKVTVNSDNKLTNVETGNYSGSEETSKEQSDSSSISVEAGVVDNLKGQKVTVNGNVFKVKNSTAHTVEFLKAKKGIATVNVPDKIFVDGHSYKVVSIASNAFKGNKNVKNVVIGKNVKQIKAKAFNGTKKLTLLTLKTSKLTKKNIKSSLKSSMIKRIKLSGDAIKKKSLYRKIFTKNITGRKVKFS